MLIRLLGTLAHIRVGVGRKGHMGVNMSSLWQNTVFLRTFSIKMFISGDSCLLFPLNDYAIG